jgi:hypothetical protein
MKTVRGWIWGAAAVLAVSAAHAAKPKYTLVQLPDDGFGARPRAIFTVQKGQHLIVGDSASEAGGKLLPKTWVSLVSPNEMFAEFYAPLTPNGGGTMRSAAVGSSVSDGVIVGEAENAMGQLRAVLWRGGLPETPPVELVPDAEGSTAADVLVLQEGPNFVRYAVVGTMCTGKGQTRGFFCLPEVGDEVLVTFLGQLPTLGGASSEAYAVARVQGGFRIVGRAQDAEGHWQPVKWEGPDFDALRGIKSDANAVEYGLITALTAPGPGAVLDIDPSGVYAIGKAAGLNGVTLPRCWKRNPQGTFLALSLALPKGVTEGSLLSVNADGRATGYLKVKKNGKLRTLAFTCRPGVSGKLTDLSTQIKSGQGEFQDIFATKTPTAIAPDGAICGQGPARSGSPEVPLPFLLLPPGS